MSKAKQMTSIWAEVDFVAAAIDIIYQLCLRQTTTIFQIEEPKVPLAVMHDPVRAVWQDDWCRDGSIAASGQFSKHTACVRVNEIHAVGVGSHYQPAVRRTARAFNRRYTAHID